MNKKINVDRSPRLGASGRQARLGSKLLLSHPGWKVERSQQARAVRVESQSNRTEVRQVGWPWRREQARLTRPHLVRLRRLLARHLELTLPRQTQESQERQSEVSARRSVEVLLIVPKIPQPRGQSLLPCRPI